jgi:hypothetical protein
LNRVKGRTKSAARALAVENATARMIRRIDRARR